MRDEPAMRLDRARGHPDPAKGHGHVPPGAAVSGVRSQTEGGMRRRRGQRDAGVRIAGGGGGLGGEEVEGRERVADVVLVAGQVAVAGVVGGQ